MGHPYRSISTHCDTQANFDAIALTQNIFSYCREIIPIWIKIGLKAVPTLLQGISQQRKFPNIKFAFGISTTRQKLVVQASS